MGQEVSIDLEQAVQQMTAIDEVAKDLTRIGERMSNVTARQVPVDWTHETGAVGFAGQFRSTGNGLVQVLDTLQKDMVEMYEQLRQTLDEFVAQDEEKQERYDALILKYNVKNIADNLTLAGAAVGALGGAMGGAVGADGNTVEV